MGEKAKVQCSKGNAFLLLLGFRVFFRFRLKRFCVFFLSLFPSNLFSLCKKVLQPLLLLFSYFFIDAG